MFNLDLINWWDGVIAEMRWGTHTFMINCRSGWTGYQAESLLRHYGVLVYGRLYASNSPDSETVGFRVPLHQASWAEYLLFRAGCPIVSPTFNPKNERIRAKPTTERTLPPGGWGRRAKGIGRIMDWMAGGFGLPVAQHGHDLAIEQRKRINPQKRGVHRKSKGW